MTATPWPYMITVGCCVVKVEKSVSAYDKDKGLFNDNRLF